MDFGMIEDKTGRAFILASFFYLIFSTFIFFASLELRCLRIFVILNQVKTIFTTSQMAPFFKGFAF